MERLTKVNEYGAIEPTYALKSLEEDNDWSAECREKLAYYEDLMEKGRLVELPCRVGTKRYYIQNNVCINWNDETNSCIYFRKNKNGEYHSDGCCDCIDREEESRVRKHIFTLATMETKYDIFKFENTYETREEAELKLTEMENKQ